MIFQNLWALAGLALLGVPVLIHLLSRKRAVLQRFPSLRFLNVTRLLPTRSPNLSDIPLLLVRLAIVALAVFALAQPLWMSASRAQSFNSSLARVIVLDTSRSMQTPLTTGTTAADSARALATVLAGEASTSVVLQTAAVASVMPGAAAWLKGQGGRGDVILLSDFQLGAIDATALANIPAQYGVRLIRVGTPAQSSAGRSMTTARTVVTVDADSLRVSAEWTSASSGDTSAMLLLSSNADRENVVAARDAATFVTSPNAPDSTRNVAVIFPGAAEASALVQSARMPSQPWMSQVLADVHSNEMFASAAADESLSDTTIAAPFAVVSRTRDGAPVVFAAEANLGGSNRLVFVARRAPSSLSSAALIAAVSGSIAAGSHLAESETVALSTVALQRLNREAQPENAGAVDRELSARAGMSDGRWLWMLALLLLGVETWMRRRVQRQDQMEPA